MKVVTNKKSPHYNKVGKVYRGHDQMLSEDKILLYFECDESIIEFNKNEIKNATNNQTTNQLPKTRKKFYEYIQDKSNSRDDVVMLVDFMIKKKVLKLNSKVNFLKPYILNVENSVGDIVQQIRMWRDEGKITFLGRLSKKSRYSNSMHYSK